MDKNAAVDLNNIVSPEIAHMVSAYASANSLKFVAIGLMAIGMAGAAVGVGNIFSSLLNSISRNPSASADLQRMAFIGAGLAEAMGLFAFVIAMILMFVL